MNRVRREARPWFLGSSSDLWQKESGLSDCRVIMWRWNSGTLHITHSDRGIPQTKTADENERTGGPFPTREDRGVRRNGETDLAVALLGFASSPRNQAALKMAHATPRSESSRAVPSTTLQHAPCPPDANLYQENRKNDRNVRE